MWVLISNILFLMNWRISGAFQTLSIKEFQQRQQRLSRMRHLLFYHESKVKRMAKIKSKDYHKRTQKSLKTRAIKIHDLPEDEAAQKILEDLEYKRAQARCLLSVSLSHFSAVFLAKIKVFLKLDMWSRITIVNTWIRFPSCFHLQQERLTQKHSTMSRWAKRVLQRGLSVADEPTRHALAEQLREAQELKKKVERMDSSGSNTDTDRRSVVEIPGISGKFFYLVIHGGPKRP